MPMEFSRQEYWNGLTFPSPGDLPDPHFHALEKEMATHSSILAWKILWTEKLSRLQSMGLQYGELRSGREMEARRPCK